MGAARLLARARRRGLPLRRRRPPPDPRDRGPLPRAAPRPRVLGGRHERARDGRRAAVPRRRVLGPRAAPPARPRDGRSARAGALHPPGPAAATAPRCSTLDHLSFDGFWRLDDDGLTNAIEATPSSRFRVAGARATTASPRTRSPAAPASTATSSGSPSIPTHAARGLRPRGRARRAALAAPPRRDAGAGQHPARQRRRARAVRGVRVPRAARPGSCVMGRSL